MKWIVIVTALFAGQMLNAQTVEMNSLLESIDNRTEQYTDYDGFTATIHSTSHKMNKRWEPKETVIIEKNIRTTKDNLDEEIVSAFEIKKGVETDISEKLREEYKKQKEKDAEKKEENKEDQDEEKKEFSVGTDALFPFAEEKRDLFQFQQLADSVINGKPCICLHAEALTESDSLYNGKFYIDPVSYDVRLIDVIPSDNPKFVKEMQMKIHFDVLAGDYFVVSKMWMRVYAGIIIKKMRIVEDVTYSDYADFQTSQSEPE